MDICFSMNMIDNINLVTWEFIDEMKVDADINLIVMIQTKIRPFLNYICIYRETTIKK